MGMTKHTEYAWAAGFWDGEGCTYRHLNQAKSVTWNRGATPGMSLGQSGSREGLDRFQTALSGLGKVYGPYPQPEGPGRKPRYRWELVGRWRCQQALAYLWSYLSSEKKDQAKRVFQECRKD